MVAYDIDFQERGFIREHIWDFLLFPGHWTDINNNIPVTLEWKEVPFNPAQAVNVPNDQKGIYCFVVKPVISELFETRYLFYIGKTARNFRARFNDYLREANGLGKPRHKVFTMLDLWNGYLHFYYAPIKNNVNINLCEERYLNNLVPKVNTDIPKARIKPELKNLYE